jgi:hypothetical protein
LLIFVSPPVFGGVREAQLSFTTSVWWGPCCSSCFHHQCLVGSTLLILVSPTVFGGVRAPHLGFTTSVWWGPCCSSWFHHQCLVGSVLLILVSPPVFGGVRVAHLFSFLCCVLFVFVPCHVWQVLPVPLDCPLLFLLVFSNVGG